MAAPLTASNRTLRIVTSVRLVDSKRQTKNAVLVGQFFDDERFRVGQDLIDQAEPEPVAY